MTQKHTPRTVYLHPENGRKLMAGDVHLATAQRIPASPVEAWANAKRLAACWNALHGIPTESIEAGLIAGLLAACKDAEDLLGFHEGSQRTDPEREKSQPFVEVNYDDWMTLLRTVRAVLSKAEPA